MKVASAAVALSASAIAIGSVANCLRVGKNQRAAGGGDVVDAAFPLRVDLQRLDGLPDPVKRYFRAVLHDGQPAVAWAAIEQTGEILIDAAKQQWRPFVAHQRFNALRPGFTWSARVRMFRRLAWPFIEVRDAYNDGRGSTSVRVLAVVPVASSTSTPLLYEAALLRYLAEAAWFPTALLPRPGLTWTAIDDTHARVTLEDGAVAAHLDVEFGVDGDITSVRAPARYRAVGNGYERTPWGGTLRNSVTQNGMRTPCESEAFWRIGETDQPYFKARNTRVRYGFVPLVTAFIDRPDVDSVQQITVDAPAELVFEVARHFDIQSLPAIRAIFVLRAKILRASPVRRTPRGLVDDMASLGWGLLAEQPGRALLMGAVTQPWLPDVKFSAVAPDEFAAYREPDRVKIVWTLEADELGPNRTRLRTQMRAAATDDQARAKFTRYWRRFGSGAMIIRRLLLRALRRRAERQFAADRRAPAAPIAAT